jgi:hypothetical protein
MTAIVTYYLAHLAPEKNVKRRIVYYYASRKDLELAKALALREREARNVAFTRDATTFREVDLEPCEQVVIMPDVTKHHRDVLEDAYRGRINGDIDFEKVALHTPPLLTPDRMEAGSTSAPPTAQAGPPDLQMMTRTELIDHANARGIKIDKSHRRDDLIKTIEAAHA